MKSLNALVAAVTVGLALSPSTVLASTGVTRPDDRAVGPRSEPATTVVSPVLGYVRPDNRAVGPRSTGVSGAASAPIVLRTRGTGFEWGDAGIGAGAGAGLVLVALGGLLLIRHGKTEPRTT